MNENDWSTFNERHLGEGFFFFSNNSVPITDEGDTDAQHGGLSTRFASAGIHSPSWNCLQGVYNAQGICVEVGRVGWGGGVWGHVRVWIAMVMCQKEKRGFDHCGAAMINEDVAALGKQHEAIGIDPVSSKGT